MNFVFENVSADVYQKIVILLKTKFEKYYEQDNLQCIQSIKFINPQAELFLLYYKSLNLMLQGNFDGITPIIDELITNFGIKLKEVKKIKRVEKDKEECQIKKRYLIGFDESGKGECFGSLFLGSAKIKIEDLEYFQKILGKKDIKKLEWIIIDKLFNSLKDKFKYEVYQIPPNKIDEFDLTLLLDEGYVSLIEKISLVPEEEAYLIDDYGASVKIEKKIIELRNNRAEVIIAEKADVNYTACMLASLVARRARIKEMERLSSENAIIDPQTGEKVCFKSGAPNQETEKYLKTYRKLNPYSDFPYFVRKKWSNIQELEKNFPKSKINLVFSCTTCKSNNYKLCIHFNKEKEFSECFCPSCGCNISKEEMGDFLLKFPVILDTSTIISRIITKDLTTSQFLMGCSFVIPSIVYEEIDTKQPNLKKGSLKEVEELKRFSEKKVISLSDFKVEDYSDVKNDKKIMRVLRAKNGIIMTKDNNQATFSELSSFAIQVVDDKEYYFKK